MAETSKTTRHAFGGPRTRAPEPCVPDPLLHCAGPVGHACDAGTVCAGRCAECPCCPNRFDSPPLMIEPSPSFEDEHNPAHPDYLRGVR